MKILKYSFLVLAAISAAYVLAPIAQAAEECSSVVYDASGGATYRDVKGATSPQYPASVPYLDANRNFCGPVKACPAFANEAGTFLCAPASVHGIVAILGKVFGVMFAAVGIVAGFVFLYAAFMYVTSEGEAERARMAKRILIYAVVALVIAALAWGAPSVIQSFLTGTGGGAPPINCPSNAYYSSAYGTCLCTSGYDVYNSSTNTCVSGANCGNPDYASAHRGECRAGAQ